MSLQLKGSLIFPPITYQRLFVLFSEFPFINPELNDDKSIQFSIVSKTWSLTNYIEEKHQQKPNNLDYTE